MMKSRKVAAILRMFRTEGAKTAYLPNRIEERLMILEEEASKRVKQPKS
jgi:hypothetical protein